MTPIQVQLDHSQSVEALAKKAGERIDKLMKSQSDAIFTYAWEPGGTRCAVQAICGGTFIVQVNLAILAKEVTGHGMIMETTGMKPQAETEMLVKVKKLFDELVAAKAPKQAKKKKK